MFFLQRKLAVTVLPSGSLRYLRLHSIIPLLPYGNQCRRRALTLRLNLKDGSGIMTRLLYGSMFPFLPRTSNIGYCQRRWNPPSECRQIFLGILALFLLTVHHFGWNHWDLFWPLCVRLNIRSWNLCGEQNLTSRYFGMVNQCGSIPKVWVYRFEQLSIYMPTDAHICRAQHLRSSVGYCIASSILRSFCSIIPCSANRSLSAKRVHP